MYRVPLVGPIWRYGGLAELFRLMTLLVKRQVPLPEALRWTAGSLRYPDLSKACRSVAAGVEAGSPLPECLARDRAFPATVVPVIAWGQQSSGLAAALQATAEMFESRARARHALLEAVLPTVILLFIGGTVLLVVSGLFLPLLSLIRALT